MAQIIHKFGRNGAVGAAWADVWTNGGVYAWPQAASQLRISSSTAADTAAGAGARTVQLSGLDANWDPITETVSLNGTSTVQTTASFIRMNRAKVVDSGTYVTTNAGGNVGTITINTGSSSAVGEIVVESTVGMGQTQIARYTCPDGLFMYINSAFISVDSNQAADVAMFARNTASNTTAPMGSRRLQIQLDGLDRPVPWNPDTPLGPYPARTDVWWSAKATVATSVTVDFEIILSPTTFQLS